MAETDRLSGRNGQIWQEYVRGRTHEELGEKYGISRQRVAQIIKQVSDSIPKQTREEIVREEIDLFRRLRAEALEVWDMAGAPVTAGKDGDVLRDPESEEIVRDHGGRLRALDTVIKLSERYARLLGIDAAAKVEVDLGAQEAAERLAEEALSRLADEPE